MKSTARLIVTMRCQRNCAYCVNKQASVMEQAVYIQSLETLRGYKEILFTGGEPTLFPVEVIDLANALRRQNPKVRLYMYTTRCSDDLRHILKVIDGGTYTLHSDAEEQDVIAFLEAQSIFQTFPAYSFNLSLDKDLMMTFPIIPAVWNRIKIKGGKEFPWMKESCVPPNEDLYILDHQYFFEKG